MNKNEPSLSAPDFLVKTFNGTAIIPQICDSHWREAKKSNREEKEKFDILFSNFEKRKRNLKFFPHFREEKKKLKKRFSTFEKRERKGFSFLKFREEKENCY